ncbi:MAG: hypothetical protein AB7K09_08415 [Planctomycetota bacterium]
MRTRLSFLVSLVLISATALGALQPAPAVAQPGITTEADPFKDYKDLRWTTLRRFEGAPMPALVDFRSTTVAHETVVPLDKEWELFGHKLTFSLTRGRLKYEHLEPGKDRAKSKSINRLPVVVELGREDANSYMIALRTNQKGDTLFVSSAWGTTVRVGRDQVFVVDSDRDGKLGSQGDGVIVPGSKTVAPFGNEIWTASGAIGIRYRKTEADWQTCDLPMPKNDPDHAAAWHLLNWRRQMAGVPALRFEDDEKVEATMVAHAKYAMRYGTEERKEDTALAGASTDSAAVAKQCITLLGARSCVDGIDQLFTMAYARSEVLSGALTRTTMLLEGSALIINTQKYTKGALRPVPVVWPPHGLTDLPRGFRKVGETPMPLPVPADGNALGIVIGANVDTLSSVTELVPAPKITLETPDDRGALSPVAGQMVVPGARPEDAKVPKHNYGNFWFVPERTFPGATEFHASVTITFPSGTLCAGAQQGNVFTYEWSFRTK